MSQASRLFVVIAGSLAVVLAIASAALMARLLTQPDQVAAPSGQVPSAPPVAPPPPAQPDPDATAAGDSAEHPSQVESDWLRQASQQTGIPERVLQAYVAAGAWAAENRRNCNLGWNTLAAIGAVESNHGRHQDAFVQANGNLSEPLVGLQLNGMGVATIPDSDEGRLDGDTEYDRAVGPMQFIPDSWKRHGLDGNGDGQKDPNNIDDAAMTAASYLCSSGNLGTAGGWERAILSYNNSLDYVNKVYNASVVYARNTDPGARAPEPQTVPATTPAAG
ncbi:hypothetical protein GCM10022261_01170 [Brevibacterium daeguense]|uniref:Transglycosylase SLT domain-containing protein n=1 Tax=Brevibacterium daeguense TaxID=909936 RepID=A0ABP8EFA9_9MICO|nr:lytic transglycosylase domain-containing protein [Brevibacterium daeguense]